MNNDAKIIKKRLPMWLRLIADMLAACVFLLVFALFHHVIPKIGEQQGVEITRPPSESIDTSEPNDTSDTDNSRFTNEPVLTDNSYSDSDVCIELNTITYGSADSIVTYHTAEIWVRDAECLKTAFANDTYGQGIYERIKPIANRVGAIFAISGDYYGSSDTGVVIRNGTIYRNNDTNSDICVLYYDGSMKLFTPKEFDINDCIKKGAWQAWTFGPILVQNGSALKSFNTTAYIAREHPRCGIGYFEPGHYLIVLVDGRQEGCSVGVTIAGFADIFASYGVDCAYNLDGGRSAVMVFNGEYYNRPFSDGRSLCDIIYIEGKQ